MKVAKLDGGPEIFETLQGEGKTLGKRAVFLRTSLCNLHCTWCDTGYTWNWEGTPWDHDDDVLITESGQRVLRAEAQDSDLASVVDVEKDKYKQAEQAVEMSAAEAAEEIMKFPTRRVVFTGGEPMLQQGELIKVMGALKEADPDYVFEVETNGTRRPTPKFEALVDQFNVSPKLNNSNNAQRLREKPETYQYYVDNPKAYFKFVVAGEDDAPEIKRLIEAYDIPADKIYLMPEGRDEETIKLHSQEIAELCKAEGYTMTTRLQIAIYGNKRGT